MYFLDNASSVKAIAANSVNKIVFLDKTDSLKTIGVFQKLNYRGAAFFQILNEGRVQLCKSTTIALIKKDYDPSLEKDNYRYVATQVYYIIQGGSLSELDAFSKNKLTSVVAITREDENWLTQNNNKLKNESEVVSFFEYYNTKKQ